MTVGVQNKRNCLGLHLQWVRSAGKVTQRTERPLLEMLFFRGEKSQKPFSLRLVPLPSVALQWGWAAWMWQKLVNLVCWRVSSGEVAAAGTTVLGPYRTAGLGLGALLPWGGKVRNGRLRVSKQPAVHCQSVPELCQLQWWWVAREPVSAAELGSLIPGRSFRRVDGPSLYSHQSSLLFVCTCAVGTERNPLFLVTKCMRI